MSFRGGGRGRGFATGANRGGEDDYFAYWKIQFGVLMVDFVQVVEAMEAFNNHTAPLLRSSVCFMIERLVRYALLIFIEMGSFMHACEGEMVCESINPKVPYFNAPIYLENKVRCSHYYYAG